jgi:hypothetical protein
MAVASTGSATVSTWINEKNAFAAFSGLLQNKIWETQIISNSQVDQNPGSNGTSAFWTTLSLFMAFSRVEHILSPERVTAGFFPDSRGPYFYTALLLVVLNTAKFSKDQIVINIRKITGKQVDYPPIMDRFLVVVSQATPYLMIITNIAMTVIEISSGDSSAWVKLAFTGTSLVNITVGKPKDYTWFLNTVLGCPVAATAFYYADNKHRFVVVCAAVFSTQTVQKTIQELKNWLQKL